MFTVVPVWPNNGAAQPDPFFQVEPDIGSKIRVESGRPSGSKNGSNRFGLASNRVQIRVQPFNDPNEPDLNPISGRVGPPRVQIWVEFGRDDPKGSQFGLSWVGWLGSFVVITPFNR